MKKKTRVILSVLLVFLIIGIIALLVGSKLFKNPDEEEITKVVDTIDSYGYTLDDRDTELMKDEYQILKETLNTEEIDFQKYAESLAKLFVIDLFTLNNKLNKYDVGGAEFVYPVVVDNYKLNVEDTLYKTIKTDSYNRKNQKLPTVTSINVDSIEESTYTYNDNEFSAYNLVLSWDYEKEDGYDKKAKITCIKDNNKLYIVEYQKEE